MPNKNEVLIINIVAKSTGIEKSNLTGNSKASDFAKWDSLAHVKIMLAIEKEKKVKLNASTMSELNSIDKIIDYLENK